MKKHIILFVLFTVCTTLFAQDFEKVDPSPMDATYYPPKAAKRFFESTPEKIAALAPKIKVLYSRPQKKGREIFGNLVPYNKLWRAGANEIPELILNVPAEIGGKKLEPGNYSFAILPTKDTWTLYINTATDMWGVYTYDKSKNLCEVKANTNTTSNEIEAFSIAMYKKSEQLIHLKMGWDNTVVEFPITLM
ncbi:DUF2911 domain-containing protein [Aquimarina agarilytica]|uniref:DUF2911 domain-containing protein n=1 Tax=Aquimarina agarilytica TaxID=1087449 RepID=UPI0002889BBF|nr:DUF2911 domain-containing protein [Aquimarina agarilytica]